MTNTATIGVSQADIAALTETNAHWNQSTQDKVPNQLGGTLATQEWCVP